jgi:hypothetical protein
MSNARIPEIRAAEARQADLVRRLVAEVTPYPRKRPAALRRRAWRLFYFTARRVNRR